MKHGLIIDNFAGGGGASTGIELALGRPIDVAINHEEAAVAMHQANHPTTKHYCQSVWRADPLEVTGGRHVALAWFSPDCKHFSKAKGGTPVQKHIRDLAWVVVLWAQRVKPDVIMLENVEEFKTWGPIAEDGRPCPLGKGLEFARWLKELKKAGYKVDYRELRASDYGAPTIRKRLFLIARRDGKPIIWPAPTHGPGLMPYRTAADIIDWSMPCPSIFERERPLKPATCKRIATGIQRFVIDAGRPFIVPLTHQGGAARVYGLDTPLNTVTGANRGEFAIVAPVLDRQFGNSRGADIQQPVPTIMTGGLGKTALVAAFLAQHNTGVVGHPADTPLSTIVGRGTQQQLVTSQIVKLRNNGIGQPVDSPIDTITAGGFHFGEVRAFLTKYYGAAEHGQSCDEPLHSATAKARFGLVTVAIEGQEYAIADIGMRMLTPRELARAQGFPDDYILDPVCWYVTESGNRKYGQLPKTHQIEKIGNSVCPVMAQVLVSANCPDQIVTEERAVA